jgi:ABC-2 type transport system permease protein
MRYGFTDAARFEWAKLRTLRSTWWLAAATVAVMAGGGLAVGAGYRGHTPIATVAQIVDNSLSGAVLAQLLLGALGVFTATGTRQATLAAVPRRGLASAAKAVVFGTFTAVVGIVGAVLAFLAAQAATAGTAIPRSSLSDPAILKPVLLTGLYLSLIGLVGLGVGTLVRNPGAAIAVLRFVPIIILANSVITVTQGSEALNAWAGIAVIALYAAVAIAAGTARYARRDA